MKNWHEVPIDTTTFRPEKIIAFQEFVAKHGEDLSFQELTLLDLLYCDNKGCAKFFTALGDKDGIQFNIDIMVRTIEQLKKRDPNEIANHVRELIEADEARPWIRLKSGKFPWPFWKRKSKLTA